MASWLGGSQVWTPLFCTKTPKIQKARRSFQNSTRDHYCLPVETPASLLAETEYAETLSCKEHNDLKTGRSVQYFCNVPDPGLMTFMDPSTLCCFRKRLGQQGIAIIEEEVFDRLKWAKVIEADIMLMDSTVLESSILYPTDVRLLFHAFKKMAILATQAHMDPWWDPSEIKKLWRAYHLDKRKQHLPYLCAFYLHFEPALETFATGLKALPDGFVKTRWQKLLEILLILDEQTQLKLEGQSHIPERLVSLDDPDARPIQKGKSHPKTEFGTTFQTSFNRQGFMITAENFIGKPNDKTLYSTTLNHPKDRRSFLLHRASTGLAFASAEMAFAPLCFSPPLAVPDGRPAHRLHRTPLRWIAPPSAFFYYPAT